MTAPTAIQAQSAAASGRWSVTLISVGVTATSFLFVSGVAFLIPSLASARRISLAEAAVLASMPSWGMVATLILWGYLTDRLGERLVMSLGSALTGFAACCAAWAHSSFAMGALLFVGGMAAASSNTAGGSLVSGWFAHDRRGLAMGIRQTAQPLGIALGALAIPQLSKYSPSPGLLFLATACTVSAVAAAVGIVDPPRVAKDAARTPKPVNPYRASHTLVRIHAVAALLMMPQAVTATFMLVWLVRGHGWSLAAAGVAVTVSQLLGALGRVVVGRWSDVIGSRMRPVRLIAATGAGMLFALALVDQKTSVSAVFLMIAVSVIAVLDNGLEATAITEFAGASWSGRALGVQNTAQRLMAAVAIPLFGTLIAASQYQLAWVLCGLFPLLAIPLMQTQPIPASSESRTRDEQSNEVRCKDLAPSSIDERRGARQ
jgi:MFS family permease